MRTARPRLAGGHRGADAVLAGLVRRGAHHAATANTSDDHGLAAQRGLVALLHRGEEGVEVQVHHRGLRTHGRNLSERPDSLGRRDRAGCRAQQRCGCAHPHAVPVHAVTVDAGRQRRVVTTILTAHGPEDLLPAVPVVLGFRPEDSLVLLTFGAQPTFHARVDLPSRVHAGETQDLVEVLLGPCRRHDVASVAFVIYSANAALASHLTAALVPAFVADGIGVVDVLRAHDGRWCHVPICADGHESPPVPYDDTSHPFSAQAVFEGRVTHATRDDLRATLAADTELVGRRRMALARLAEPGPAEVVRVCDLVAGWVARGEPPDEAGACRLLRAVTRVDVRD